MCCWKGLQSLTACALHVSSQGRGTWILCSYRVCERLRNIRGLNLLNLLCQRALRCVRRKLPDLQAERANTCFENLGFDLPLTERGLRCSRNISGESRSFWPVPRRRRAGVRARGDHCTLPLWKTRDRWVLDSKPAQHQVASFARCCLLHL